MGGEKYCTSSLVFPVINTLLNGLDAPLRNPSATIEKFRKTLAVELKKKFYLDPLSPVSLACVSAAMDPRSRSLAFLPREEDQLALKTEIKQLAFSLAPTNKPAEEVVAQPTPAKISKLSRSKRSDEDALSFFFNTDQCADEIDQRLLWRLRCRGTSVKKPVQPST